VLIDATKPGLFVTFERAGHRKPAFKGESNKGIWLKLHNNYQFEVEVPTFNLGIEPDEIGVTHSVVSTLPDSRTWSRYSEEVSTMVRLAPGESIVFSIPAEHLSESTYLRFPFTIESETRAKRGGPAPQHFAVFHGSSPDSKSLPKK
jgi:hypothetical protein